MLPSERLVTSQGKEWRNCNIQTLFNMPDINVLVLHHTHTRAHTEQFAIVKTLTQLRSMHTIQRSLRTTAIHTDSRITLEAIANPRNHQNLVESIRKELRTLEEEGFTHTHTHTKRKIFIPTYSGFTTCRKVQHLI